MICSFHGDFVQWNLSMLATYGVTKKWPTDRKSYFLYAYIYRLYSYNNYPNRIIILHTSTDNLWFTVLRSVCKK
jgi:hypothetical protein